MLKMSRHFFECLLILTTVHVFSDATVITQTERNVIADGDQHLLYVKVSGGLRQIANSEYRVTGEFENGEYALSVDYNLRRNLLFWSTSRGEIFSCPLQESRTLALVRNVSLVYRDDRWLPASLAVDHLANRLYVLDTRTNTVWVVSLDGKRNPIILGVGAENYWPTFLEVDANDGFVFLMDDGVKRNQSQGHILRMRMDGSEPQFIDPPSFSREIQSGKMTVDRLNKRIIVSSKVRKMIFSIDYEGRVLDIVLEPQNGTLSMSATNNELFWVNADYYRHKNAFRDGSVFKCKLNVYGRCLPDSTRKLHDGYTSGEVAVVKIVEPLSQPENTDFDLCKRVGCEHVCLAGRCVCEPGFKLKNDLRSCEPIDRFMLYEDQSIIRGACLDKSKSRCIPHYPFKANMWFKPFETTGFDYDPTTRQLYYGGIFSIYRADLATGIQTRLLLQRGVFYGPMVIDWTTKNLYYTEIENRNRVSFYIIKVASARAGPEIAQLSSSYLYEVGRVSSMAIHPRRGYLFFTSYDYTRGRYHVHRIDTNGKNPVLMLTLRDAHQLALDLEEDRVYVWNRNSSTILSSNLEGVEMRLVADARQLGNLTGLAVHGGHVYAQNRTSARRLDLATGAWEDLDLAPYDRNMASRLSFHEPPTEKADGLRHLCAVDNGGCDNFCFAVPSPVGIVRSCRCYDGVPCNNASSRSNAL